MSPRKRSLFACACWGQATYVREHPACVEALRVAELFAEGQGTVAEWEASRDALRTSLPWLQDLPPVYAPLLNMFHWDQFTEAGPRLAAQVRAMELSAPEGFDRSALPEEVVLFATQQLRSTAYAKAMAVAHQEFAGLVRHVFGNPFRPLPPPGHLSSLVCELGAAVCNFHRDAIGPLYDALLDSGLTDLAEHFAHPDEVHPRGCWALDLLTGRD